MISRSTRRGLIVAGILAVTSWWFTSGNDGEKGKIIDGLDTRLDYALINFEMDAFDTLGKPTIRLKAPKLTNDATTRIGHVTNPTVIVNHEGFEWNLVAESAIISADQEEVLLEGAVTVQRTGAVPEDALNMNGENVLLLIEARIAQSDYPVLVADLAGELRAVGFQVDMLNNEFELKNSVQGIYVTPP